MSWQHSLMLFGVIFATLCFALSRWHRQRRNRRLPPPWARDPRDWQRSWEHYQGNCRRG